MSEPKKENTLKGLLLFIHKDLSKFSNKKDYTKQDNERLIELAGAIQVLWDFAKEIGNNSVYEIADDFDYAIYHINNFKGDVGLNGAKEKIDKLS